VTSINKSVHVGGPLVSVRPSGLLHSRTHKLWCQPASLDLHSSITVSIKKQHTLWHPSTNLCMLGVHWLLYISTAYIAVDGFCVLVWPQPNRHHNFTLMIRCWYKLLVIACTFPFKCYKLNIWLLIFVSIQICKWMDSLLWTIHIHIACRSTVIWSCIYV
jgi:hypothetical protein